MASLTAQEVTRSNSLADKEHGRVNPDFEDKKSFNSLLGLISYIKQLGLDYVLLDNSHFHHYLQKIGLRKFDYNFCFFENVEMQNWFRINKFTINDELKMKNVDGHAGIRGNEEISKVVINYINKIILGKKIII